MRANDFDPGLVGKEGVAIGHVQFGTSAHFARKFVKRRLKPVFPEMHAGQCQLIELPEPGCSRQ